MTAVAKEAVAKISKLAEDVELQRIELAAKAGALDLAIAEAVRSVGGSVVNSKLCLGCGTVQPKSERECPGCRSNQG